MAQPYNVEIMQQMMQMLQRQHELIDSLAIPHSTGGLKVDGYKCRPTAEEVKNLSEYSTRK